MSQELEHLLAIGSSSGGVDAVIYIVPKLILRNTSVVLVPHIYLWEIYDRLRDSQIDVEYFKDGIDLKRGKVFVKDDDSVKIAFTTRQGLLRTGCIDDAFGDLAGMFREKCIGVILSGYGDDGALGVTEIKRYGGKVFVQVEEINDIESITKRSDEPDYPKTYTDMMPKSAAEKILIDFAGNVSELVKRINEVIGKPL